MANILVEPMGKRAHFSLKDVIHISNFKMSIYNLTKIACNFTWPAYTVISH